MTGRYKYSTLCPLNVMSALIVKKTFAMAIYPDRLQGGASQSLDGEYDPSLLGVEVEGVVFDSPLKLQGKAYLAGDHLVLHYDLAIEFKMPCSVCNREVVKTLVLQGLYSTFELKDIPHRVWDFAPTVRESILLELPARVECEGSCPHRQEMQAFLKH